MKGNVLKVYEGPSSFGVPRFLERWQTDALAAMTECSMGDRDSYAGQYHSELIDNGFLDKAEVERVCLEWLTQKRFIGERPWRGFDDVVSIAGYFKMPTVLAWIVEHFQELLEYLGSAHSWSKQNLIGCVAQAKDIPKDAPPRRSTLTWKWLRDYLWNDAWADGTLFNVVYVIYAKYAEPGEVEQFLCGISKRARVYKRVEGDNEHLVSIIFHMLLRRFGYDFRKDTPKETFDVASARAERWLLSQATRCAFPV